MQRLHSLDPGVQLLRLARRVGHPAQRRLAAAAAVQRELLWHRRCGVGFLLWVCTEVRLHSGSLKVDWAALSVWSGQELPAALRSLGRA